MRKRRAFEIQSRIELTGISKLRENGLSIVPERIYLSLSLSFRIYNKKYR